MSEEEIKKQYANGIVNADEVIKSLIDKFKTDKTSVDIQQLQLIAEYLLYEVDKLQKENEELKEQRKELNLENQALYESINCNDNNMLARRYYKLQKENEELKEQRDNAIKLRNELIEEQKITCISKNEIRNKIKELEEKDKMFKLELSEDVTIYQYVIDILEELLGE